jgi:parallel beta-helix repeat protein
VNEFLKYKERKMLKRFKNFRVRFAKIEKPTCTLVLLLMLILNVNAVTIDVTESPYNAAGNGTTDDTDAIQDAIDENPNSTILLKDGTFKITSTLTLKSRHILKGDNATLLYSSTSYGTMVSCESNVDIEDLKFDGNEQSTNGIYIGDSKKNIFILNCELFDFAGNSTAAAYAINIRDNCSDVSIIKTKIHDVDGGGNGIQADTIGANRAILMRGGARIIIDHCEIYNIGPWEDGDCIQVQTTADSDVVIRGSKFYNFMKRAVKIQASGVVVTNNIISCAGADDGVDAPAEAIGVMAATSGEISNNIIILNRASWAISVTGGSSNIQVNDNITDIYGYYYTQFTNMSGYDYYHCRSSYIRAMFLGESDDCTIDKNTSFTYFRGMHIRDSYDNIISNNNVLTSLYPFNYTNGSTTSNNTSTNNSDYTTVLPGFWRFNDSTDITTTFDFPDGNYNGTPVGFTSAKYVEGIIGNALSFDGTDDFINMGDVLDMGTSNFSICAWVKSTDTGTSNANGIIYKRGTGNYTGAGYSLNMPNGTFTFHIADGTNYMRLTAGSSGDYNDGEWHLVTAVADRGTDMKVYVDGLLINSSTETTVGNVDSSTYLSIGGLTFNGTTCYNDFNGTMDEVMIYNKALSVDEINKIYLKQEIK